MLPFLFLLCGSNALMIDVIVDVALTAPVICPLGCVDSWTNLAASYNTASQSSIDAQWMNASMQAMAGSFCAIPGNFGVPLGALCYCKGSVSAPTNSYGYCADPVVSTPQQINLQFGSSGSELQVAFVTHDYGQPLVTAPMVELCGETGGCINVTGTTTRAPEPQDPSRVYSYHFVPLPSLAPASPYSYRCLGGTAGGAWSAQKTLITRDPSQPLRFSLFGDMGLYPFNNIGNVLSDLNSGELDMIVHLGDVAYNEAMSGGFRGDAWYFCMEEIVSVKPMMISIGNHEFEGSPFGVYCNESTYCEGRYLNQTAGALVAGSASGSDTNLYYSLDVELVHFVNLDAMPYLGLGSPAVEQAQVAWLEKDLASVDRAKTPWLIVITHVPMYCSAANLEKREVEEPVEGGRGSAPPPPYSGCDGSGGQAMLDDFEPLFLQYGVDLVSFGHVHAYESMWPIANGTARKRSYNAPDAPVYLLTGAAGPPGDPETFSNPPDFSRKTLSEWSYGKVTVWNATHLTYQHIINANGTLFDEWTIYQPNHAAFA
jgi:hypothetical protein